MLGAVGLAGSCVGPHGEAFEVSRRAQGLSPFPFWIKLVLGPQLGVFINGGTPKWMV